MTLRHWFLAFGVAALVLGCGLWSGTTDAANNSAPSARGRQVELFEAIQNGDVDAKFIARSDRAARLFIANKTNEMLNVKLPEAFAGVPMPVAAQFGGGGGGRGGGGRGGGGGGGGGTQSVGGGLGGGGGGGGQFSVPPEEVAELNFAVVCLDHGLRDPSSSKPYKIVPAEEHIDRPAVIELLKAFGNGKLQHGAAQAAAWHLNNDLSWEELAAKRQGTKRNLRRPPYFNQDEMRAAVAYASEAQRLAALAEEEERAEKAVQAKSSEEASESEIEVDTDDSADFSESRSTAEE
jgi:hypothetical protein